MLQLSLKELAHLFSPDMAKGTPGWLVTYYIENDLVSYEFLWENGIELLLETGSNFDCPYMFN